MTLVGAGTLLTPKRQFLCRPGEDGRLAGGSNSGLCLGYERCGNIHDSSNIIIILPVRSGRTEVLFYEYFFCCAALRFKPMAPGGNLRELRDTVNDMS